MWNNQEELKFLKIYQTEPILWDPTHPSHKDKNKLRRAWERISEQIDYSVEDLKKKKISLMATFRGHIRDINASFKAGAECDEIHKPCWFAFDLMYSFLGHLYKCKRTVKQKIKSSRSQQFDEVCIDTNTAGTSQDLTEADDPLLFVSPVIKRCRSSEELEEDDKQMKEAITTLCKTVQKQRVPEDDCDRFGKILANKLRKLADLQRMQLMWEIDGLFIKAFTSAANNPFVQSSSSSVSKTSPTSEPDHNSIVD